MPIIVFSFVSIERLASRRVPEGRPRCERHQGLAPAPLAIENGQAGREAQVPMAVVILGGLASSLPLTLLLPALMYRNLSLIRSGRMNNLLKAHTQSLSWLGGPFSP